jgi:hypothetical protein
MSGKIQAVAIGSEGRNIADNEPAQGMLFSIWIEDAELQRQLAAYDPAVGTSPGVADARLMARPILNAALAGPREGGAS